MVRKQRIDSLKFLFHIGVELINNIVFVTGVQQGDSVIHISILFQILFPFRLLQSIEQNSLRSAVGPCGLSILNTAVCPCPNSQFIPPPAFPLW